MRKISLLILAAGVVTAQTAFEVASIKRSTPPSGPVKGEPETSVSISGGTLTMRNVTLKDMIIEAYRIKDHQLSGPPWLRSDRYDVIGKAADSATGDRIRQMLQRLLADRFKLEIHRENKDLAVTAMVIGKNGPKLGKPKPEGPAVIGIEGGKMTFQNYSMAKLADYLSQRSGGRPVEDATAIDGYYDFSVQVLETPSDNPVDVKRAIGMGTRDGSLARTITEEIGLRLELRKGPVEMIVVDHAEKSPTEN
jgi:uncharacterized protein (TIGR03435 family)